MTSEERETDQPNEAGFAGAATTPEPQPDDRSEEQVDGESIAVPAGDLTGGLTAAIEGATGQEREDS